MIRHSRSLEALCPCLLCTSFTILLKFLDPALSFSQILTLVIAPVRWTPADSSSPINHSFRLGSGFIPSSARAVQSFCCGIMSNLRRVTSSRGTFPTKLVDLRNFLWQQANPEETMLPKTYDTRSDGRAPWRQTGADLYTHGDVKSDPERTALPGDHVLILSPTFIFPPYS